MEIFKSSKQKLKDTYREEIKKYFESSRTNSDNASRDKAVLAHNELLRRSNNRFSITSITLTVAVGILSLIALYFSYHDYEGDKNWEKQQLNELKQLNLNISSYHKQMDSLSKELNMANQEIVELQIIIKRLKGKEDLKKTKVQ